MAQYKPNHREFARFMKSPGIHKIVRDRARKGVQFLRSIAPVDEGNYKQSISVESGWAKSGDRPAAFITVDDDSAAPMEWGNAHIADPPRPLERTREFIERGG